jgi:hypothetical protein
MTRSRVAVGAVALAVLVGTVVAVRAATAPPDLPGVSPRDLVASAVDGLVHDPTISGEVRTHVDLGVPALGDASPFGGGPLGALLGDQTLRVWRSPDGLRVAQVESTSERDVYVGRNGAWAWDFGTLRATRLAPAGISTALFPLNLLLGRVDAGGLLRNLRPTTRVVVDGGVRVAGRPAYRLALVPRTTGTLVGHVEIDVDADHRVPLAVRVVPRGSARAALSVGFTSVSFAEIAPGTFDFTPPPGGRVRTGRGGLGPGALLGFVLPGTRGMVFPGAAPGRSFRSFGHGWAGVAAVHFSLDLRSSALGFLAQALPLSGPLLSARLAQRPDGQWFLFGPVPQSTLERYEARLS